MNGGMRFLTSKALKMPIPLVSATTALLLNAAQYEVRKGKLSRRPFLGSPGLYRPLSAAPFDGAHKL